MVKILRSVVEFSASVQNMSMKSWDLEAAEKEAPAPKLKFHPCPSVSSKEFNFQWEVQWLAFKLNVTNRIVKFSYFWN